MKKIIMKKIVSILMVCLLVVLTCTLFACNDDTSNDIDNRERASINISNAFLSAVDDDWRVSLDNQEIASLDNAGDYIMTKGWLRLVVDVIKSSSMQTAKLEKLATTLASDPAKLLIREFYSNATSIIPLLRETGLTSNDISTLVNGLLLSLVNNSESAIDNMLSSLNEIKALQSNIGSINNINSAIATLNSARSVLSFTTSEKREMITAFESAEYSLASIIDFAYTMSLDTITEELFDILASSDGVLGDISNSELTTLVDTLMLNVSSLKNALSASEIASLNRALNLIIENFDTDTISSTIYMEIIKYAKYAYTLVDIIPTLCDVVVASGDMFGNVDFLNDIKLASEKAPCLDEETNATNSAILLARLINSVMSNFTSDTFVSVIDNIASAGITEYQKAVPIMSVDILLNLTTYSDTATSGLWDIIHKDVMDKDMLAKQLALVGFLNGGIDKLKQGYKDYLDGKIDAYALGDIGRSCSFSNFDVENPYSVVLNTAEWYNYYMTIGISKVNSEVAKIMPAIVQDLKGFANDYYADGSNIRYAILTLADMDIFEVNMLVSEYQNSQIYINSARLSGLFLVGDIF